MSDPSPHPRPPRPLHPEPLRLDFEGVRDGVLRAIVCGEIDFASAASLQAQITVACERHRARRLILDLAGVDFMDSSGLRAILHLQRELTGDGGVLVLLDPTPEVRNVLSLTGLDGHLALADTLAQAHELVEADTGERSVSGEEAGAGR